MSASLAIELGACTHVGSPASWIEHQFAKKRKKKERPYDNAHKSPPGMDLTHDVAASNGSLLRIT